MQNEGPWQVHEGAMRGLRVLDLSRILSGPFASMVLADLGADVIKIEDVDQGDDTRRWGPPFQGEDADCLSRDPGLTGPRGANLSQRGAR